MTKETQEAGLILKVTLQKNYVLTTIPVTKQTIFLSFCNRKYALNKLKNMI